MQTPFPDSLCPPFEHAIVYLFAASPGWVEGHRIFCAEREPLVCRLSFQLPGETPVFMPSFVLSGGSWCEPVPFEGAPASDGMRLAALQGEPASAMVGAAARIASSYEGFRDPASASVVSGPVASALAAFVGEHVRDPASLLAALRVMEA